MTYSEELNLVQKNLLNSGRDYESEMHKIGSILAKASQEKSIDFDSILQEGLIILSSNAGSHTDLDVLESVLDGLYDLGIIDGDTYELTVKNSGCGRWM